MRIFNPIRPAQPGSARPAPLGRALHAHPSGRSLLIALFLIVFALNPANAAPNQDQLKLSFGKFDIFGTYSKRSCAAQTFLRSAKGQRMGFLIYWVPRKSLFLSTKHPSFARTSGKQVVQFRFPDGQVMAFNMKKSGDQVQANIGFGSTAKKFYKMIEANNSLRIELPGLGDVLDVDMSRRRELESAMRHCRDWLKS